MEKINELCASFSFLALFLTLGACINPAPKKSLDTDDTSNVQNKIVAPTNDSAIQVKPIPNAYFKVKVIDKKENIDSRVGTDSKSMVELWIDENKIDEFEEYGDGDIFEDGLQANLNSEMSEKIYLIELIDSQKIKVNYSMIYEGEEKQLWNKTYAKQKSSSWKMVKCVGQCEEGK